VNNDAKLFEFIQVPAYLKTLSLVYHAFRNMQLLEYMIGEPVICATPSQFPSCSGSGNATDGVIRTVDVEELLNRDGFSVPYWSHTLFLVGFFIVFRILGYIALRRSL